MMELSTLVERPRQGQATALSRLVAAHWRFVYTICPSQVRQAADAEDLTQEVFVRASRDLRDLRDPARFSP
jgi:DNA-directed RNA polymerase specialized sigma24 family protein